MAIMPLQCGTQLDWLADLAFDNKVDIEYNASHVSSEGAMTNDLGGGSNGMVGRDMPLDVAHEERRLARAGHRRRPRRAPAEQAGVMIGQAERSRLITVGAVNRDGVSGGSRLITAAP